MKIAVITPAYDTPQLWLAQCLESVRCQTIPCTHFLVSDGDFFTKTDLTGVEYLQLPKPHLDNGNAARAIGSVSAISRNFDAIAYLDADNWFEAEHLQQMVDLHLRTGAAVCTAARNLVDLEGNLLGRCPEVDGKNFADTSSLFFTRAAFGLVPVWYRMPHVLAPICDRVVWKTIQDEHYTLAHCSMTTVNFRTCYRVHYEYFGKTPPANAKHVNIHMTNGQFISAAVSISDENPARPLAVFPDPRRNRVSLCMILKNEEANLTACLAPLATVFDEIIVVDTGSTDRTKEIARGFGAKVFDFIWADSFATARNETLQRATGEWIFWLDADERLDEHNLQKLRRLLAELPEENNVYMMAQRTAPDPLHGSALVVEQARLFRNLAGLRWSYRVHEQIFLALRDQGAKEVRTDIAIHHLAYQESGQRQAKQHRNLRLLQIELAEKPRDAFVLYKLANSYTDQGQFEQALPLLRRSLECAPPGVSYLPKVYFLLIAGCQLLGREQEALSYCCEGKKQFPHAADLLFQEGILLLGRDDLVGARKCFEMILELRPQINYIGGDAELTGCRTRHNLAITYRRLGLQQNAEEQWRCAVKQAPHFGPAWLGLVELFLEQNRQSAVEGLLQSLEGKAYRDAVFPAVQARFLLSQRNITGARQILEEALAENPNVIWLRTVLAEILLCATHDKKAAEHHLRFILAMSPNDRQVQQKLARLLQ